MKRIAIAFFAFVLAGASVGAALAADTASSAGQSVVRAGTQASAKGPEAWFTGTVRIDPLFPDNAAANVSGAYVTFEPGARSAWHEHPAGQTLVVISGVGLTGTSDGKVVESGPGTWCVAPRMYATGTVPRPMSP